MSSASPQALRALPAPPVTNSRLASALLAVAGAERPGSRPAQDLAAAARTVRQLETELHGSRVRLAGLPAVSARAAGVLASFLACSSDEAVDARVVAMLDRLDPDGEKKRDFLSRAEVDRILSGPGSVGPADLSGDLHLHTERSDGQLTLETLHRKLASRGDRYALLTDHARDCSVAGGLFPADFAAQRAELDGLNERTEGGFTMFLGAESNVAEDGSLDLTPATVPALDGVIASIHSDLRNPRDQTGRLVHALETRGVAVLGHPRGRLYNVRRGVRADWSRVFSRAAELGVAIELNGCPERLDLDPRLARLASEAGCVFAISSDAHAARHLDFQRYGLAVARLAEIPAERIVNTFSRERFASWLEERRGL